MIWKKYFNEIKKEVEDRLTFLEEATIVSDRDRYEKGRIAGEKKAYEDISKKIEDLMTYGKIIT